MKKVTTSAAPGRNQLRIMSNVGNVGTQRTPDAPPMTQVFNAIRHLKMQLGMIPRADRCATCGGIHTPAAPRTSESAPRPSATPMRSAAELAGLAERPVPQPPSLRDAITAHRATVTTPEPKRNLRASFDPPKPVAADVTAATNNDDAGTMPAPRFSTLVEAIRKLRGGK